MQTEEEMEKQLPTFFTPKTSSCFKEAGNLSKVFWYIIIGIAIGAAMHGFIPKVLKIY